MYLYIHKTELLVVFTHHNPNLKKEIMIRYLDMVTILRGQSKI